MQLFSNAQATDTRLISNYSTSFYYIFFGSSLADSESECAASACSPAYPHVEQDSYETVQISANDRSCILGYESRSTGPHRLHTVPEGFSFPPTLVSCLFISTPPSPMLSSPIMLPYSLVPRTSTIRAQTVGFGV